MLLRDVAHDALLINLVFILKTINYFDYKFYFLILTHMREENNNFKYV